MSVIQFTSQFIFIFTEFLSIFQLFFFSEIKKSHIYCDFCGFTKLYYQTLIIYDVEG